MVETTERFTNRVEDYVKYRPSYPAKVLDVLRNECGLTPTSVVADVGSGTGMLSKLFCDFGCTVYGVEPNQKMREAGERYLSGCANFVSVNGSAEMTNLNATVDFVTAAQAFHWFHLSDARHEFMRILKPNGWAVLVWNDRKLDDPFGIAYEALMVEYSIDYNAVKHQGKQTQDTLEQFYGHSQFKKATIDNPQRFDRESLIGRVLSASYVPKDGQPRHEELVREVNRLFDEQQKNGAVVMGQETNVFYGQMS